MLSNGRVGLFCSKIHREA